ncbi:hypothetical protein KC678_04835 [Candidatus Dojkabacteria bacterium]|uniref:DUF8173 domain-containing protein n=1 Tax=Candidatus Dojkabacteria bacterium TaxID=2099670 RepID=A0A955L297_9BACT|nr:hypothetical protein [Candidatus Dojkabacteria bacterium]
MFTIALSSPVLAIVDTNGTSTESDMVEDPELLYPTTSTMQITPLDASDYDNATVTDSGSIYLAGNEEVINSDISNDVVFAGSQVVINGDVLDNIIVAGGAVEINGNVNGDVLFAGGMLILNGNVSGDVRAFGGSLFINSETVVGDVLVSGGQIGISSRTTILGDLSTNGFNTELNATNNPTTLGAAENMDLPFNNDSVKSMVSGLIAGLSVFALILSFLMLIGSVFAGYVFIRIFPVFTEKTLETMKKKPGESVGYGCLTMVVGIILILVLFVSVIGIRLLFLLMVLGVLALMVGGIYARYMIGRMLLERFDKKNTGRFIVLLVGTLVVDLGLFILGLIPILAIFTGTISFFLTMWGMGAIIYNKYNSMKS